MSAPVGLKGKDFSLESKIETSNGISVDFIFLTQFALVLFSKLPINSGSTQCLVYQSKWNHSNTTVYHFCWYLERQRQGQGRIPARMDLRRLDAPQSHAGYCRGGVPGDRRSQCRQRCGRKQNGAEDPVLVGSAPADSESFTQSARPALGTTILPRHATEPGGIVDLFVCQGPA